VAFRFERHDDIATPDGNNEMATFHGTIVEFQKYIGPLIRNNVQSLTKARKRKLGSKCEECGEKRELEAAHIGTSRPALIQNALKSYEIGPDGKITVDLEEARRKILEAHKPIEKHIRLLCRECHEKLDALSPKAT